MQADNVWDCIVVGAGIVGSCTAYHLAKRGKTVLLLDQFMLPHTRGSSHGGTRIIRYAYSDPDYAALMDESFQLWRQIEKEGNTTLLKELGLLTVQGGNHEKIIGTLKSMARLDLPSNKWSSSEITKRFPLFTFPPDYRGAFDTSAGVLYSDRCLAVLRTLIVKNGGVIQDGERVDAVLPGHDVTIVTNKGSYITRKVVLTPGPWASDLLQKIGLDIPLKTMPGRVMYWKTKLPKEHSSESKMFPIVIHHLTSDDRIIYSIPCLEYPSLVKIVTRGEPPDRYCHPDERDLEDKGEMKDIVTESIRRFYPGISDKPSIVEPCMYTMTPDKGYVLDRHPIYTNVFFCVGMSGHGFKTGPVIGKILSELATDRKPSYDVTPFSFTRFSEKPKSRL